MILNVKKTDWKKIRFQLALNKTFCPIPPPLTHQRFCQRTKINKILLSATSVFHTKFTISVLKSTKVFHPNGNWTRTARVLNWVSTFCAITDSQHKFHKTGIENWLTIGFNLALITTTLRSTTNRRALMWISHYR